MSGTWADVLAALPPRRRVHIHNAISVYSLRVSLFRRRAVSTMDACACCGELAPRAALVDADGDRVHSECAQVAS